MSHSSVAREAANTKAVNCSAVPANPAPSSNKRSRCAAAINNLAVLHSNTGKTNDAASPYGIKVAPENNVLHLEPPRTRVRLRERDKARELMQDLLARRPGNATALRPRKELDVL
jgi:hypothetical protein